MSADYSVYQTHPAAEMFPTMTPNEIKELAEDIRRNGLLEPIMMSEGKVLDGRGRLVACGIAGIQPRFQELPAGVSPSDHVWSANYTGRHLALNQRVAAAHAMAEMTKKESKQRMSHGGTLSVKQYTEEKSEERSLRHEPDAAGTVIEPAEVPIISPDEIMPTPKCDAIDAPRASYEAYTDAMVAEGWQLLNTERTHNENSKKSSSEVLLSAFRFGRLVWEEVLRGCRGERNKKTLLNYLKDVGYLPVSADKVPTSVYNYKYIYIGAGSEDNVRSLGLSRDYYIALGQTVRGDDFISAGLVDHLRSNPVVTDGVPDDAKIKDVAAMISQSRKALQWNPRLKELEETRGAPFDWERLGTLPLGGLQDCLLHGLGGDVDRDTMKDTIWEMIRLEGALATATGQDFRGHVSRRPPWLERRLAPPSDAKSTPKGLARRLDRQRRIHRLQSSAMNAKTEPIDDSDTKRRLFLGDARTELAAPGNFLPGSIDIVTTDPPYSELFYASWRPEGEVSHHMEDTPEAQAKLVAEVAEAILSNGLHRPEGFAWVQFCPMTLVHEFAPPLLKVFDKYIGRDHYDYQIAIWDKKTTPKVQGTARFTPQCEAILIVSVGRPFRDIDENGNPVQMHSPIFPCPPTKVRDDLFWKPVELLKTLIRLFTYGDDGSREASSQIVLDPFGGAGSTAVAAIELGRDYRIIESHEGQFELAKAEIEAALAARRTRASATAAPNL